MRRTSVGISALLAGALIGVPAAMASGAPSLVLASPAPGEVALVGTTDDPTTRTVAADPSTPTELWNRGAFDLEDVVGGDWDPVSGRTILLTDDCALHVVRTVPGGVLESIELDFDPALPADTPCYFFDIDEAGVVRVGAAIQATGETAIYEADLDAATASFVGAISGDLFVTDIASSGGTLYALVDTDAELILYSVALSGGIADLDLVGEDPDFPTEVDPVTADFDADGVLWFATYPVVSGPGGLWSWDPADAAPVETGDLTSNAEAEPTLDSLFFAPTPVGASVAPGERATFFSFDGGPLIGLVDDGPVATAQLVGSGATVNITGGDWNPVTGESWIVGPADNGCDLARFDPVTGVSDAPIHLESGDSCGEMDISRSGVIRVVCGPGSELLCEIDPETADVRQVGIDGYVLDAVASWNDVVFVLVWLGPGEYQVYRVDGLETDDASMTPVGAPLSVGNRVGFQADFSDTGELWVSTYDDESPDFLPNTLFSWNETDGLTWQGVPTIDGDEFDVGAFFFSRAAVRTIAVAPVSAFAGQTVTVTGEGFAPGPVSIELGDGPIALGEAIAAADGTFEFAFDVPEAAPVGDHLIRALQNGGLATAPFEVTQAPPGPDPGGDPGDGEEPAPGGGLPATGVDGSVAAIPAALLAAGVAFLLLARRSATGRTARLR